MTALPVLLMCLRVLIEHVFNEILALLLNNRSMIEQIVSLTTFFFFFFYQILGICFAQNLRADIYAQKAKWNWRLAPAAASAVWGGQPGYFFFFKGRDPWALIHGGGMVHPRHGRKVWGQGLCDIGIFFVKMFFFIYIYIYFGYDW